MYHGTLYAVAPTFDRQKHNMKKFFFYLLVILLHIQYAVATQLGQDTDTLKVLAIGNSFSEDAIENYLYELADAVDKKIIIGNLYIGGAPIDLHVKNAIEDNENYSYRKTTADGTKTTTEKVSISQAMEDEEWSYISLQQVSQLSGKYDIIMEHLPHLWTYVTAHADPDTKLIYHQTWAYQHDSDHGGFANYDRDQKKMYKAIVDATKKIDKSRDFEFIVPAGTAIQNARSSSLGDTFTRDGYHLELNYGRFTAACTWYQKLFDLDVRKNAYKPEDVSDKQATIAKEAAYKAVRRPFRASRVRK